MLDLDKRQQTNLKADAHRTDRIVNGLSFDVEDWFHTQNYASTIPRTDWPRCEFRAIQNTARILGVLDKHGVFATFFVLGWVADRAPEIVSMILEHGHEVASHGFSHRRVGELGPAKFRRDLQQSLDALSKGGATSVRGFRAPSFSITATEYWAFEALEAAGLRYDSSVVPTSLHPHYGVRDAPLSPYQVTQALWEVPITVLRVLGLGVPAGGGAYFRFFPYEVTRRILGRVNREMRPFVVYLHPWEFDSEQPVPPVARWRRLRQTRNVEHTTSRLERLLSDFKFAPVSELVGLSSRHADGSCIAESRISR